MGPLARRRAVAILISLMIAVAGVCPASALSIPGISRGNQPASRGPGGNTAISATGPSGRLQEVAAPGGVQQLRHHLAGHHPRLSLKGPSDGAVLNGQDWALQLEIEDWPLASDSQLGIGPHVAVQIDNQPPLRFTEATDGPGAGSTLKATLPALSPGSHRISAYAAYPWGEAVKGPGASLHWRLHQYQALRGTQPEQDAPWLAMVSPAELGADDPLLLDWLVWNAPLQNLRDGDGRWRLRITLNGDSFLVDRQEAIWIRQNKNGGTPETVQMELLDGLGDPISPTFNNQLRTTPPRPKNRPVWLQSRLNDSELARLLGEQEPEAKTETLPVASPAPKAETNPESVSTANSASASESGAPNAPSTEGPAKATESAPSSGSPQGKAAETATPAAEAIAPPSSASTAPQPSSAPSIEAAKPREIKRETKPALEPTANEPRLAPTTSLGGSARELLNPDGTQR